MQLPLRSLRFRLAAAGLLPTTRLARLACYLLGLDLLLFVLQALLNLFGASPAQSLRTWVILLSFPVVILFFVLGLRWVKARLLWRLRHRLIVTYVFIGVIPAVLLILMAFISLYLFAGQFANFVVTSELNTRLQSLASANEAIAHELAGRVGREQPATAESLTGLKRSDREWARRQVCAWDGTKPLLVCTDETQHAAISLPRWTGAAITAIVSDRDNLYLRTVAKLNAGPHVLTVVCSEPLDRELLTKVAGALGEITLYAAGYKRANGAARPDESSKDSPNAASQENPQLTIHSADAGPAMRDTETRLRPLFVAGYLPPPSGFVDRVITFGTPLPVMDWESGELRRSSALLRVETRPSAVYSHLFAALGDFATGVEYVLLITAVVFAAIELLALWAGTRLTRSVTGAVAQLYEATKHINRGDFSHKIPIRSNDQLAALAASFNSMTTSIQQLIEEQKAKQRLENELLIAQEVQAQLFPQHISQLESLEVHGFCRPARTVSGDYYDFLNLTADKLVLAVGDVSGKGISAALLMATIHSAVRAYSLEGIPVLREPLAVGVEPRSSAMSGFSGVEVSPAALLSLLNHQLYMSTPTEKYATLFLGIYDARERRLTYSNAGHLPPLILSEDGSVSRLEKGGTVVGLFDEMDYQEATVPLRRGEVFLAYSDGVTEPENDFGEFGETRLVDLVLQNRDLPLVRITEIVTAAVDDWIGDKEQPDDVTLVLARAR